MQDLMVIAEAEAVADDRAAIVAPRPSLARRWAIATIRRVGSGVEWLFGVATLLLCLAVLSALPVLQLLSYGYMLECSGRVARSGRMRDGLIGVRRAARVGGVILGVWISRLPMWLIGSFAETSRIIDPGGPGARAWQRTLVIVSVLTFLHAALATARGGRLRYYLWPLGNPIWLVRRLRRGGLYVESRDGFFEFLASLRLPHYARVGFLGFLGTLIWIGPPSILMADGIHHPIVGVAGAIWLAVVVSWLPILQVRFAAEGKFLALFALGPMRDRFRRAPWAFAFGLLVLCVGAIPLYLLKIEMIPQEAAWLPSLVFVIFLLPARFLIGWAYARSSRRERPRFWLSRIIGRLAILPVVLFYVLVVILSQYTSWGGVNSLYEQHAFLVPVPFLSQ